MEQENFSATLDFKRHLSYLLCAFIFFVFFLLLIPVYLNIGTGA